MGFLWQLTVNDAVLDNRNGDLVVFDLEDVETVLLHVNSSPSAPRIPTGLFIQSMEFVMPMIS
jgi:hypothetical protein